MAKLNEHELAVAVSKREGKQHELSIAQIKEVLKCTFDILAERYNDSFIEMSQIVQTIEAHI